MVFPNNEREITIGIDVPCRWDLIVLIDVDTDKEADAEKEVTNIIERLKRNLTLSAPSLLDSKNLGWRGEVLLLCTAQQDRLEMEAELLGLPKPMVLTDRVASKHGLDRDFARVTAPFSVARRALFHEVPYIRTTPQETDLVRNRGAGRDQDASGLVFFSATERQMLIERIVEYEVRSAIASGRASPHTRVRVFPPHDDPPNDVPAAPGPAAADAADTAAAAGDADALPLLDRLREEWAVFWCGARARTHTHPPARAPTPARARRPAGRPARPQRAAAGPPRGS
jgi:hypothetical protein